MTAESDKIIKIGILEADRLYPDLISDYQSYGVMFTRLFQQLPGWPSHHFVFEHFNILEDQWPTSTANCDAYLITGSKSGVYDQDEWIKKLTVWIQQQYRLSTPLLGICFGHQILAHALGGYASQCDRGWGVGTRTLPLIQPPSNTAIANEETDVTPSISLIYSHQDQVSQLPPAAQRLLGDDFCPYAAFEIPSKVLAFQGHPEFTAEYLNRLLPRRIDSIGPDTLQKGLASLTQNTDDLQVAQWMIDFITDAVTHA